MYFLAMEMTRRRFASTISFLAWRASRSPFCTICTILRNSPISSPVSPASTWISWRCCLTLSLSRATRLFQPFALSLDTRLIEPQRLHLADDLVLELLVAALLRGRERIVAQLVLDVLVLQAAQPLVGIGDIVERLDHFGLEFGLDGGKRKRVLHIVVVVEIAFAGRSLAGF